MWDVGGGGTGFPSVHASYFVFWRVHRGSNRFTTIGPLDSAGDRLDRVGYHTNVLGYIFRKIVALGPV